MKFVEWSSRMKFWSKVQSCKEFQSSVADWRNHFGEFSKQKSTPLGTVRKGGRRKQLKIKVQQSLSTEFNPRGDCVTEVSWRISWSLDRISWKNFAKTLLQFTWNLRKLANRVVVFDKSERLAPFQKSNCKSCSLSVYKFNNDSRFFDSLEFSRSCSLSISWLTVKHLVQLFSIPRATQLDNPYESVWLGITWSAIRLRLVLLFDSHTNQLCVFGNRVGNKRDERFISFNFFIGDSRWLMCSGVSLQQKESRRFRSSSTVGSYDSLC